MTAHEQTEVLACLKKKGSKRVVEGMARYGLPAERAVGVSGGLPAKFANQIGKVHRLAEQLWQSGIDEARLLATLIDGPQLVTVRQMDAWTKDFDSWGICDSACFLLFDRSPLAYKKAMQWSREGRDAGSEERPTRQKGVITRR